MSSFSKWETPGSFQLISFSLDVEICGFLFSLYQSGSFPSSWGRIGDNDLITLSHNSGAIYGISSKELRSTFSPITGKITSIVLVVGLGSLLCYRLFKLAKVFQLAPFLKSKSDSDGPPPTGLPYSNSGITPCYFGPKISELFEGRGDSFGKRTDASSVDSDCSPITNPCSKNRRLTKRHKGWIYSNWKRYMRMQSRQDESYDSTDSNSSPSPVILSLRREGSIDSMCSDLSLDLSALVETTESCSNTKFEQLQEEIDQLKNNCQSMDEEFETIRINRNMPGLASLMESSQETVDIRVKKSARACFRGLYSLTTINRSMSFDLSTSTDDDSPVHISNLPAQVEEFSSLEWDTQDGGSSYIENTDKLDSEYTSSMPTEGILPMDQSWSTDSFDQLMDSTDSLDNSRVNYSGQELDISSTNRTKTYPYLNLNNAPKCIMGQLIPLWDYGTNPRSRDPQCLSVLENCGFRYVREIYKDGYSILRAPFYQTLCLGYPVPNGHLTVNILTENYHSNSPWLSTWKFHPQLSYGQRNFMRGVQVCLTTLENVITVLDGARNRTELLMTMINTDPTLDAHLLEAIKLHMLAHGLSAFKSDDMGNWSSYDLSQIFNMETPTTPVDFMNNYVQPIGDSETVQNIGLALLGLTLNVTIQVAKPSAFGSDAFLSYFPENFDNSWPLVSLITEDDRGFDVLLK